jgi:outer membrane lipoprotein-sorting protein
MEKIASVAFGGAVIVSLLSYGWQAHEQAKKRSELQELCQELTQFSSTVQQRKHEASREEMMGGAYARNLALANCQDFNR